MKRFLSKFGIKIFFLYPAILKSAGYYVIPSVQKFVFECPSVRPSALRFNSLQCAFLKPIFSSPEPKAHR